MDTTDKLYNTGSEENKFALAQQHNMRSEYTFRRQVHLLEVLQSPQLDQVHESARPQKINTIGERFIVKEDSATSVGTRPWTPEGRSLTLSIAFML
ncbi:hypothetical protein AVEN_99383-1 [Araneus ventricosus]|uniref:Uncharacterized protein n=1 Tax=Araneus ventricosus TaxID=182803 RepID=A0A4Y2GSE7_ARAVE|nr:hypothetical protein AVEN_99383-1 [Araneus ventricosus]